MRTTTSRSARGARWLIGSIAAVVLLTPTAARADIAVAPTSHNFGDTDVGVTSGAQVVTITTVSSSNSVTAITKAGTADCADFTVTPPVLPATVNGGSSPTFSTTFTPTRRGAYSCAVSVISDAPSTPDIVTFTGTGRAAELTVSPASLGFGNLRIGSTTTLALTLSNTGDAGKDLDITSVSFQNAGGPFTFTPAPTVPTTLTPGGATMTVTVQFAPVSAAVFSNTINVVAAGTGGGPIVNGTDATAVSGTGIQAVIAVASPVWPQVVVGDTSDRNSAVSNSGAASMSVTSMTITGTNANQFEFRSPAACVGLTSCSGALFTVNGGSSTNVSIRCKPTSVGAKAATLTVTSNAESGTNTAALSCTGVKPDITVNPTSLDHGSVALGSNNTRNFTVSNANTATTSTLTYYFDQAASGDFAVTAGTNCTAGSPCTLAANASAVHTVRFTPTAMGTRNGSIGVVSDDQENPTITVSLTGVGTRPVLVLVAPASPSIAFGDVPVSTNGTPQTVTIRNDGNSNLDISSVQLVGANANQFSITSGTTGAHSVTPTSTDSWGVRCNPTSQGNKSATFRVNSNDPTTPQLNIALTCRGTEAVLAVAPNPVNFPNTRVGDTSSPITVTLSNTGNIDLSITSITLANSVFTISTAPPSTPFTITPGSNQTMALTFSPVMATLYNGSITLVTNAGTTVVPVTGRGELAEISLNPPVLAFNDVRVDQPVVNQVLTITNTGTASFVLSGVQLSNTTDFSITKLTPAAALPQSIPAGGTATFRIGALPASLGAKTSTVTVNTDIPGAMMIQTTATATGVAPDMVLSSSSLNFGTVDIDDPPPTQTLTVTNSGTATLRISAGAITGAGAGAYAIVGTPSFPMDIAIGNAATFDVTYTPSGESAGEPAANLDLTTDALSGGAVSVPLMGRGVDRHIDVSVLALSFPQTYRNPENPPQESFDITNTGGAPLAISMLTTGGAGASAFTIVGNTPMVVAPGGTETVTVEFNPNSASSMPFEAQLIIMNDDDDSPAVSIDLNGLGVLPNVAMMPGTIDLGATGVGIPSRLSTILGDTLQVINQDATDSFRVREIRLVDANGNPATGTPFSIVGFTADETLDPMSALPLDLDFTPTQAGQYEVIVELFLDADPERIAFVTIRAEAVDVKLRGGGCSVGTNRESASGLGGGFALAFLVLMALGVARRSRRSVAVLVAILGIAAGAPAVRADITRNLDLATFRPAPSVESKLFAVETPGVGKNGAWEVALTLHHATNLLVVESPQTDEMTDAPITGRSVAELAFAYAFLDRFEAGVMVPMLSQTGDRPMFSGLAPAEGAALGDIALHGKASLIDAAPFSVGASTTFTIPTATDGEFAGVDGPTWAARLLIGLSAGRVQLAANGGVIIRSTAELADIDQGKALVYGLGAGYRVAQRIDAIGELVGSFGIGVDETGGVSPLEASLGGRYRVSQSLGVAAGIGRGVLPGIGAPDFRGFVLVSYAPGRRAVVALPRNDVVEIVDRGDDDGDGIMNSVDKCPLEAEDMDNLEDEDGCPEVDADGDGLADTADLCPSESEDLDGFKDDDGCMEADNDEDGIPDVNDKCPNEPEDKDKFADEDGCDDPDNDDDGIPDVIDQCPLDKETINGNADDDGCADAGDSSVMVMTDRIELFEPILFTGKTAKINLKKSLSVLSQVAGTLRANRSITRVRIAVHVHPRGASDQELSQERAEAIRAWLVQWGLEPERFDARGYGSTKPLVDKKQRGAAALNDRVEFILLEKAVGAE